MRVVVSRKNAFKNNQTTIEEEREGESERWGVRKITELTSAERKPSTCWMEMRKLHHHLKSFSILFLCGSGSKALEINKNQSPRRKVTEQLWQKKKRKDGNKKMNTNKWR